jgi:hypothetical protein
MKKYLLCLLIVSLFLGGCGPSLNQLKGEEAYYAARVAMNKQAASTLLFEMTAGDTTKPIVLENVASFKVFAPPVSNSADNMTQYTHQNYAAPWLNMFTQTLGMAAPWIGAAVIANSVASNFKDVATHNQPANNTTNITAGGNAMTGGTMTQSTSTSTVMSNTVSGTRNTATLSGTTTQSTTNPPLIVTQPPPVIVTQPPPVIVTQPPPVVVQPSYPPK